VTGVQTCALPISHISGFKIKKKSIDARSRQIKINLTLEVYVDEPVKENKLTWTPKDVSKKESVIVIGAGPAGLFAAMRLIELGKKPIILERGKDVQGRRRDLAAINKLHLVNPDSNYCFGEGGAGTYSDGKLYTRSNKRGNVQEILELFVAHGADESILSEAHPHIGTNKLPQIIIAMRENILKAGGEVHFNTRVTDISLKGNKITAGIAEKEKDPVEYHSNEMISTTGHSSRDMFELLY